MQNPIISIIVPCYNQAQYLGEALQSVLDQTFINWECVIVNDGSPDNTKEVAEVWIKKDSRFKYLEKPNGGLSSARNAGITIAKGEFILPLDADDKIGNLYCELAMIEFEKNTDLRIVYCKANTFGLENGEWQISEFSAKKMCLKNIIFCSAFFRKIHWKIVGGYDENMVYGLEDWEFWIAILKNDGKVFRMNVIQFYYRIKEKSMITEISEANQIYLENYVSQKHVNFFIKNLGSFPFLEKKYVAFETITKRNLRSKKFVLKLFLKTFFGKK
jgi:glycosyltransferase involved in cell wall biosynthesis